MCVLFFIFFIFFISLQFNIRYIRGYPWGSSPVEHKHVRNVGPCCQLVCLIEGTNGELLAVPNTCQYFSQTGPQVCDCVLNYEVSPRVQRICNKGLRLITIIGNNNRCYTVTFERQIIFDFWYRNELHVYHACILILYHKQGGRCNILDDLLINEGYTFLCLATCTLITFTYSYPFKTYLETGGYLVLSAQGK